MDYYLPGTFCARRTWEIRKVKSTSVLVFFAVVLYLDSIASGEALDWTRQFATNGTDSSSGVSCDGTGNVYISGVTYGNLGGLNAGSSDAFLSKYDSAGNRVWMRQFGTNLSDVGTSVSADRMGNVYISGYTSGNIAGSNVPGTDAFLSKYNDAGDLLWTRQLEASRNWNSVRSNGVSADSFGNVYMSGSGSLTGTSWGPGDAFVSKYNSVGDFLWTRQLRTNGYDVSSGVSADGFGNVYISGFTDGNLGGTNVGSYDAFVTKYNGNGNLLWTRQIGTDGYDISNGVSADGLGNVYISGYTYGNLANTNEGLYDAFVSKYDSAGNILWIRQLGTSTLAHSKAVSADGLGNVYISGSTFGVDSYDAFLSKFNDAGDLLWTRLLDSGDEDDSNGVSADGHGNVYIAGYIYGWREGIRTTGVDAFVAKFGNVPEPCTLLLAAIGCMGVLRSRLQF
jgi:hypothetical protein